MSKLLSILSFHSSLVLFGSTLAQQLGVPLPVSPILLTTGAMAAMGQLNPATALGAALLGSLAGDWTWYFLGRYRGAQVQRYLCRLSTEKHSCVGEAEGLFRRHGPGSVAVSKFIPGISIMVRSMAGVYKVGLWRFSFYDALATMLYLTLLTGTGYLFRDQLAQAAHVLSRVGGGLVLIAIAALMAYAVYELKRCHCCTSEVPASGDNTVAAKI
jgi:membrane protein DedA with SNARE-associated domain